MIGARYIIQCGNLIGARYIPYCSDLIGVSNIPLYTLTQSYYLKIIYEDTDTITKGFLPIRACSISIIHKMYYSTIIN